MTKHHKNKPGGQTKPPQELAVHRITVGLTGEEYAKVEQWSEAFRISKSEVLRRALERARLQPPLPLEQQKLAMDIGRIGHNMNQVARRLHTLHGRIDVAEKYRVTSDVKLDEVVQIAQDCQKAYDEALTELELIRDILLDRWDGVRGRPEGGEKP